MFKLSTALSQDILDGLEINLSTWITMLIGLSSFYHQQKKCCNLVKQNQHQEVFKTCTEYSTTKVFHTEVPVSEDTEVFSIRSAKSAQKSEALEHFNMQNICSHVLFWWE